MRKTLIAALLAAAIPAAAFAMPQDGHHQGQRHSMPMFKELDLSKEQRQQMSKLMREHHQGQREIHQRYLDKLPEAERKAMQAEVTSSRAKHHEEMRKLLSADQRKAFDEQLKKMEARHAERAEFLEWKKQKETSTN